MTLISFRVPIGSITASLQPVRNAGSNPSTQRSLIGGWVSRRSTFIEKTSMLASCARSLNVARTSRSTLGIARRDKPSRIAAVNSSCTQVARFLRNRRRTHCSTYASLKEIDTCSTFSFSPRSIAMMRCGCTRSIRSL